LRLKRDLQEDVRNAAQHTGVPFKVFAAAYMIILLHTHKFVLTIAEELEPLSNDAYDDVSKSKQRKIETWRKREIILITSKFMNLLAPLGFTF